MSENYKWSRRTIEGADKVHLFRYLTARGLVIPTDVVVDAACGWGEGSRVLSEVAHHVYGIDYRQDCIDYARHNHKHITFIQQDLNRISRLPDCDVAVSIETIEHLDKPEQFATLLQQAAKRAIFVSTPIVPTKEKNKDHKHEFTPEKIQALFKPWKCIHWANQGGVYGLFMFVKP